MPIDICRAICIISHQSALYAHYNLLLQERDYSPALRKFATGYGPRTMAESKPTVKYPTSQCRMALVREGLWGIVSGTETAPAKAATAKRSFSPEGIVRWLRSSLQLIRRCCIYLIGDPEDPVAVWQKLQNQFQKIS